MKNIIKKFICFPIILLAVSCSTMNPKTQQLTINTTSPEAEIYVDGQLRGVSPVIIDAERNRNISIVARKEGYEPSNRTIGHHFNEQGQMDIIGTVLFLFPVVGLVSPGAWSLDETNVSIPMFPYKRQ